MSELGPLERARLAYCPDLPSILSDLSGLSLRKGEATESISDQAALKELFPHLYGQPQLTLEPGKGTSSKKSKVGVVLSGGQAAGGHNVIAGLFDGLKGLCQESELIGFLNGPGGIVDNKTIALTADLVDRYRNLGGFDMIGSGRTKIETPEQLAASAETVKRLALDGLVVIGGDDSNTNAAVLAEYFLTHGCQTQVIGVPKTIDGDLKNEQIEISFGHDTACRIYAELVGNLMRDAMSARKYYHFVRLMGRSASHITLECALRTRPNLTLIGEEVRAKGMTLRQIVSEIADVVADRTAQGKNYGVVLIPEGLIEFIPEVGALIEELNDLLPTGKGAEALSEESQATWGSLPEGIQSQLLLDRDPHGNVQVSMIETEKLLSEMVKKELKRRSFKGKFGALHHFFGYEGRSAYPTNFDARYCSALGQVAAFLIHSGVTGYMSSVRGLAGSVDQWIAGGVPLTMMMNLEQRHGRAKPVIQKALVELDGAPFKSLAAEREKWKIDDCYGYPGPIQFSGPHDVVEEFSFSLKIESNS